MAANQVPIFQKAPKVSGITIVDTDTTTLKTSFTAGTEGALVDNVSVTSDDTSAVTLVISINDGTTDFLIGEVVVPIGAGTDGTTPAVNLFDANALPFLQEGGGIPLNANFLLKVNAKATVTAAKTVTLVAFGGDY